MSAKQNRRGGANPEKSPSNRAIRRLLRLIAAEEDPYANGHAVDLGNGQTGLVDRYVGEVVELRPHRILVIGSGTGLVPSILRWTQKYVEKAEGETWLVDKCDPSVGFGGPWDRSGWLTQSSRLRIHFPEIRLFLGSSSSAAKFFKVNRVLFDLIFVDGDHSEAGVRQDLMDFSSLLSPGGRMLFHDYNTGSVATAVETGLVFESQLRHRWRDHRGAGVCCVETRRID